MPRRCSFAALAAVALIGVAGCGGSEDEAARCEPVPAWFLAEFGDGSRPDAEAGARPPPRFRLEGRTLGDSAAVQSSDSFEGPLARAGNAWFVSVDVRPEPGIETWFIPDELFRTGPPLSPEAVRSGVPNVIIGAGPEPSAWRPGSPLDFYGISPDSDGLMESVRCVEKGLP